MEADLYCLTFPQILYEQRISSLKDQLEHPSVLPSSLPPPTAMPGDHQMDSVQLRGSKEQGKVEREGEESLCEEKVRSALHNPKLWSAAVSL